MEFGCELLLSFEIELANGSRCCFVYLLEYLVGARQVSFGERDLSTGFDYVLDFLVPFASGVVIAQFILVTEPSLKATEYKQHGILIPPVTIY